MRRAATAPTLSTPAESDGYVRPSRATTEQLNTRVPRGTRKALRLVAAEQDMTHAEVLTAALADFITRAYGANIRKAPRDVQRVAEMCEG